MKKFGVAFALTAILSGSFALTAFAGSWLTAKDGWWYRYDDGSYPVSQWVWLDGNNDGVYECYYFNQGGYLLTNTHTPDGYYVDANGAWVADGVVQTKGEKKQITRYWIYGTYEIHGVIDGEMEVDYYSDSDMDYVKIEGVNSSLPYHLGEFTGTVKYKNGNQYIATNDDGGFIKFTYNGDSIDVTDNGGLSRTVGAGFRGFLGRYNKVRDLSNNVS